MTAATSVAPVFVGRMLNQRVVFTGRFKRGHRECLTAMVEAQQGMVQEELDASATHLVSAEATAGKGMQKQVAALNAKGARIQVSDADTFAKLIAPTADEVAALLRGGGKAGSALLKKMCGMLSDPWSRHWSRKLGTGSNLVLRHESFDGLDLQGWDFCGIGFDHCSFVGGNASNGHFAKVAHCDFSNAILNGARFHDLSHCRLLKASLNRAYLNGSLEGADFSEADLAQANASSFSALQTQSVPTIFRKACLRHASVTRRSLVGADFSNADLTGANLTHCNLARASFENARLAEADFTGSDLRDATVAGADLTHVITDGAKLEGVDFSKAKAYSPPPAPPSGPASTELDSVCQLARRVTIEWEMQGPTGERDQAKLVGNYLHIHMSGAARHFAATGNKAFSKAAQIVRSRLPDRKILYGTVDVSSTKSPKAGKELRALVLDALAEAFEQPLPPADKLAEATKAHQAHVNEQREADKERREKLKAEQEKQKAQEKKKAERTIARQVGKVTDIATFLKALELRADGAKIAKATKMLKAEKFQLFNDITDDHLNGVVKSQSDSSLLYACRIESSGVYACCTQNLNICGGLRGSPCKHLLVLIIGLVKAGQLDPSTIDAWVAKAQHAKPELNKETMGEIFLRYKGAEAGEVDWRPTQTVPEDYYAL